MAESAWVGPRLRETQAEWTRVKAAFRQAIETERHRREALLDEACGVGTALRAAVEVLLEAHDANAGSFLEVLIAPFEAEVARALPSHIGAYRVVRELGRGESGTVYLGEGEGGGFRRTVAIRVLRRGREADRVLRRFGTEWPILAGLEHTGIAQLYDSGTTDDGLPYFVMEYVAGEKVLAYCQERRLSIPARVALFCRIGEAVQFAHQHLVLHRHLRPSSVLVTAEGDPKLLDFGISEPTSPEPIRNERVTTASDVYSLGVILYELLSGRRPFPGPEPPAPSTVVSGTPRRKALRGDLDSIVLKALRQPAPQRYATAVELVDDLGRYLEGRPVRARADRWAYRTSKLLGRLLGRHPRSQRG